MFLRSWSNQYIKHIEPKAESTFLMSHVGDQFWFTKNSPVWSSLSTSPHWRPLSERPLVRQEKFHWKGCRKPDDKDNDDFDEDEVHLFLVYLTRCHLTRCHKPTTDIFILNISMIYISLNRNVFLWSWLLQILAE